MSTPTAIDGGKVMDNVIVYLDESSTGLDGLALDGVRVGLTFALAALSFVGSAAIACR